MLKIKKDPKHVRFFVLKNTVFQVAGFCHKLSLDFDLCSSIVLFQMCFVYACAPDPNFYRCPMFYKFINNFQKIL